MCIIQKVEKGPLGRREPRPAQVDQGERSSASPTGRVQEARPRLCFDPMRDTTHTPTSAAVASFTALFLPKRVSTPGLDRQLQPQEADEIGGGHLGYFFCGDPF